MGWKSAVAGCLALVAATPAAAEWREASSDHFLIYANSEERWLREFAERLERVDSAMRYIRSMKPRPGARSNRLTIYVVTSADSVQSLCGKGCKNVAGFYVPRAGGSIAFTPREAGDWGDPKNNGADIVLFHEYAHHLMLENYAAAYPRWFVEGFAEFNATTSVDRDGSVQMGRAAQHRAIGLLNARPIPIETLLDDRKARLSEMEQDVFYGRAWLLTHMLTFDAARQGQLTAYLKAINDGKSSLDAGRAAFGDLKLLQRDMDRYLAQPKLSGFKLPADRISIGPVTMRTLSPGEAGTINVRMRSDRGVTREQALALLPEARRRASAFPGDPGAQGMLAEAEYDAGNDAECEAAADRVLAADPKSQQGLLYKGRARLRIAAKAKASDPAVWKEARGWFVKANRLDNDAAEPLMLYYTSFLTADQTPPVIAVDGLLRAFELSPQDAGLRLLVVRQDLKDDQLVHARAVLEPLAYDPHAGPENFALKLIAMIDAGKTGPAITAELENDKADGESENKKNP